MSNNKKSLVVYNIVETNREKPFWNRIGTAFENRDGSFNVVLNSLPLDGKLHIREPNPKNGAKDGESVSA